jgi:hypothetical protein
MHPTGDKFALIGKDHRFTFRCPNPASLPKVTEAIIIDKHGDLHLVVGEYKCIAPGMKRRPFNRSRGHKKPVTFLVSARALAQATPVFDRMLFGVFAESVINQESGSLRQVSLPDDKAGHMKTILQMIHGNFKDI